MDITVTEIITWVIVGALAGSLTGLAVTRKKKGFGHLKNLGVGLAGALIGGLLFLGLCLYMILKAAKLYHTVQNRDHRVLLKMALLSLCTIMLHSALNELIEVDKVGAMFWLNLVLIHKVEIWYAESLSPKRPR